MPQLFVFSFVAFFTGILGIILGGPFRLLVLENEAIESKAARLVLGFVFFPPVVGVCLMLLYFFFAEDPDLRAEHWGAIVGLISGMSYSFVLSGRKEKS